MSRRPKRRAGFIQFGAETRRTVTDHKAELERIRNEPGPPEQLARMIEAQKTRAWNILTNHLGVDRCERAFIDGDGNMTGGTIEETGRLAREAWNARRPGMISYPWDLAETLGGRLDDEHARGECIWAGTLLQTLDDLERRLLEGDTADAMLAAYTLGRMSAGKVWELDRGNIVSAGAIQYERGPEGGKMRAEANKREKKHRALTVLRLLDEVRAKNRRLSISAAIDDLLENWPEDAGPKPGKSSVYRYLEDSERK